MSSNTAVTPAEHVSGHTSEEAGSSAQRERRKRILDATIELAAQGGFDAVQMRTVADHADVALGTLYRYFPSKIHLLVSALGREFDRIEGDWTSRDVPGDTPADRVLHVLRRTALGIRGDRQLVEALTRAFMFADGTVQSEINQVGMTLTRMLTRAMRADVGQVTDEDIAIARVIGDVWLAALVGWVTGRLTDAEIADHMDRAVRLILR